MWIIGKYGFISLVVNDQDPSLMQVRARVKMDILMYFPDARIETISRADYMFRANVPRTEVARIIHDEIMEYDVTSHVKDVAIEYSPANPHRRQAYYAVWSALAEMQPRPPYFGLVTRPRKSKKSKKR